MKSQKLSLTDLQVSSFITALEKGSQVNIIGADGTNTVSNNEDTNPMIC